jgi:diaminobutyrate-2-oxoglutarate transaminase
MAFVDYSQSDAESTALGTGSDVAVFERRESNVRGYCRSFPAVFSRARGATIWDEHGRAYVDFFAGAGTINYGHNEARLKAAVIAHLADDAIVHSLDLYTVAKRDFLEEFERTILAPRGLDYRIQFPGPTGTNAVESALKLARKITGRRTVVSFSRGYHGMTLGSLALTANPMARAAAGVPLPHVLVAPYDRADGCTTEETLATLAALLDAAAQRNDPIAALVLECVQGEGGINVASPEWLRGVAALAAARGILLVVDDIQAGCGRTGTFFSFETAGITPDIVLVSKAIGGIGMPMALVLMKSHLDVWQPGEHNGTFRGFNLAFVAATAALRCFWQDDQLTQVVAARATEMHAALHAIVTAHPHVAFSVRGRGMMQGLHCPDPALAARITTAAWTRGLIAERSGPDDEVVKLMPPLTITDVELRRGLTILHAAVLDALTV